MRISKLESILAVLGVVSVWVSCSTETFHPIDPCRTEKAVTVENGKLVLTYRFTQDIRQNSVILGNTMFVSTDRLDSVSGRITFPDARTLKFTSEAPVSELVSAKGGKVYVKIVGTSPFKQWVSDINGNPLDGNCDGASGGDFQVEYPLRP